MPYSPLAIANEFIDLARCDGKSIEHMKIQKLIHFAHGYGLREGVGVSNENPQVWKFGPVFDSLYHELKYHGSEPIKEMESENYFGPVPRVDDEDADEVKDIIRKVWNKYKNYTGFQLSDMTHKSGTPWHQMVIEKGGKIPMGLEIPSDKIKSHYESLPEIGR